MKLRTKFLLVFLSISIAPILIITLFTYDRYTSLVREQTRQVAANVFDKAVEETNAKVRSISRVGEIFQVHSPTNDSLVEDLQKYATPGNYTPYDIMVSNNNMKFICQSLIYSTDYINGIFVFTPTGVNLGYGYGSGIDVKSGYLPFEDRWYRETMANEGRMRVGEVTMADYFLTPSPQPSVGFSKAIYNVYTKEFLGVLLVDCSPDVFDLSSANTLPENMMLAIENHKGHILYSNVDNIKVPFTADNTMIMKEELELEGLTLLAALNFEQLYEEFGVTRILIIVIAAVCAAVFIIISVLLSHYLTKPIAFLSRKMADRSLEEPELERRYVRRTDEIGILYNEYYQMLEDLQRFVKEQYQNKLITLDSQMRSLEAQINSHFLYNTLESINSIAEIEEIDSISTMSMALGSMFRYSIKTQSELVPLADELKHVHDYVSIQQIRFDNKFRLELDIPAELNKAKVLKLILQPIVENALCHGLQFCNAGDRITIRASAQDSTLYFEIEDNGAGICPKRLKELVKLLESSAEFTELGQRTKQSIGLKNIHTRIVLYYGEGYGLQVHSRANKEKQGTTVSIKLPIYRDERLHLDK